MKLRIALALTILSGGPAFAAPGVTEHQQDVVTCLQQMENGATWEQCLNVMFSPCATDVAGTDEHVACLTKERDGWAATQVILERELVQKLTVNGGKELLTILNRWDEYVGQKCAEVGEQYAETGAKAATLGCEISEMSGITVEFVSCYDEYSTAPYCQIEDK